MTNDLISSTALTMTSREIAELVGSRHDSVLTTCRDLKARGVLFGMGTPYTQE